MRKKHAVISGVLLASVLTSTVFAADGDREIDDDWRVAVGGYLTDFKTDASVGTGSFVGTTIRLEDDLGIPSDRDTFRLDGLYRFNERHAVGFGYWALNRDGQAMIEEQIEFDGNIFDVGASIESKMNTSWIRADWRYSLVRSEHGRAGFIVGLSVYDFDVGLAGMATVSDGMGGMTLESVRTEEDVLAPVPTVGFFMTHVFRRNMVLRVEANLLDLEVSDYEGKVVDTSIVFDWYFWKNIGVGVGINNASIDIRNAGDDPFAVEYNQSGILAYLSFAF